MLKNGVLDYSQRGHDYVNMKTICYAQKYVENAFTCA